MKFVITYVYMWDYSTHILHLTYWKLLDAGTVLSHAIGSSAWDTVPGT